MGNWRDRFEKSINQKTERKLSVYFELYEGAWIPADSPGIWKTDRSKMLFPESSSWSKMDISAESRHRQEQLRFYSEVSA